MLNPAAERGERDTVVRLLDAGADPNAWDEHGLTPLYLAARMGHAETVDVLLARGADPNARGKSGQTPLHGAAAQNQVEVARRLLAAGADVLALTLPIIAPEDREAQREQLRKKLDELRAQFPEELLGERDLLPDFSEATKGPTPFQLALLRNSGELVRLFLQAGADPNQPLLMGMLPLGLAASMNALQSVEALLEAGADPNAVDETGITALTTAVVNGRTELVMLLLAKGADPNAGEIGPLVMALQRGDVALTELLLKAGGRPQEAGLHYMAAGNPELLALLNHYAKTGWHEAVARGDREAVVAALDAGAELDARGKNEATGLFLAVQKKQTELAQLLLERGADPNLANDSRMTPLHQAALAGLTELVLALIEKGASLDPIATYGWTPGWLALQNGHDETFRALAEHGAEYGLVEAAALGENESVLAALEQGADVSLANLSGRTLLHAAARRGNVALLQALIARGADLELVGEHLDSPLMHAVHSGKTEAVALLLDAGAKVNAQVGRFGFTALTTAIQWGSLPMVELLIARGADVNQRQLVLERTPLHSAASPFGELVEILEALLKAGADPNAQDGSGETALGHLLSSSALAASSPELAGQFGQPPVEMVRSLLTYGADPNLSPRMALAGKPPIVIAKENGWEEIVALLLAHGAEDQEPESPPEPPDFAAGAAAFQKLLDEKRSSTPKPYYHPDGSWAR